MLTSTALIRLSLPFPKPYSHRRAFLVLLCGAAGMLFTQLGYGIYVIVRFGQDVAAFDDRGA